MLVSRLYLVLQIYLAIPDLPEIFASKTTYWHHLQCGDKSNISRSLFSLQERYGLKAKLLPAPVPSDSFVVEPVSNISKLPVPQKRVRLVSSDSASKGSLRKHSLVRLQTRPSLF